MNVKIFKYTINGNTFNFTSIKALQEQKKKHNIIGYNIDENSISYETVNIEKNLTNLQIKNAMKKAIKYIDDYDISVGIYETMENNRYKTELYSYDITVTLWNDGEMLEDFYVLSLEDIVNVLDDDDDIIKALKKEMKKIYKYLSNHFNNIEYHDNIICQ